jgi:ABC-type uncharacterized transport system substrate-binding protein
MPTILQIRETARRAVAAAALLALAACASAPPEPAGGVAATTQPEPVVMERQELPSPSAAAAAAAAAEAAAAAATADAEAALSARIPEPSRYEVAVLFASDYLGHADVAAQIAELLPADGYRLSRVDIRAAESVAVVEGLRSRPELVTVAVGLDAVEFARARLGERPIVFCQVFNYRDLLGEGESVWGVHSVPPLALQLRAWKAIDGSLRRIGLIVSEAQTQWLENAVEAAARVGVEIRSEVSASDRETLYLFKRLAPQVDGFWLLPDNMILSPAVLEELLGYALSHDVGVLVFNEALLDWGALISASSTTVNVARTVRDVVARVAAGRTEGLAQMTPLSEVSLQFNAGVAKRLGVDIVPESSWVLREPD